MFTLNLMKLGNLITQVDSDPSINLTVKCAWNRNFLFKIVCVL